MNPFEAHEALPLSLGEAERLLRLLATSRKYRDYLEPREVVMIGYSFFARRSSSDFEIGCCPYFLTDLGFMRAGISWRSGEGSVEEALTKTVEKFIANRQDLDFGRPFRGVPGVLDLVDPVFVPAIHRCPSLLHRVILGTLPAP